MPISDPNGHDLTRGSRQFEEEPQQVGTKGVGVLLLL